MTKILFIQVGSGFRYPNRHIIKQLEDHFPGCKIHLLDVLEIVKKDYLTLAINAISTIDEYFFDLLSLQKTFYKYKDHFLGTPYIFKVFSKLINKQLEKDNYDFIFQTQCMCDSTNDKGVPFYIYTDHTNLNNLNYRYIKKSEFLHSDHYIQLEKRAFDNAKLIFVMSPNIKESLISQYGTDEKKIKMVYVSTNTPVAGNLNRKKYSNKNILFVGKDWQRKGGPLLLKAFRIIQANIPDATLTIIGCNPKVKLKNCHVLGELPLYEVATAYNQASVFCMPTVREPFGIVFLEAMFNRLPIITNEVGATPYIVRTGYNGYLLHNDAREYAGALMELLNDPARCEQYGNHSFAIANEKYTWGNVGELLARYIRESH